MIVEAIAKTAAGNNLTRQETAAVMGEIMSGNCTGAQIGAILIALRIKGETAEEITGAAESMRSFATRIAAPADVIDTCGTGGDGQATFNISTAAAIVAAGAGARVAKHGNRSVSSTSGSSQALEALGLNINLQPEAVSRCLAEAGIAFLFAPMLHGAMKHAIGPRKELGLRTIFNLLGPLTNPAGARRQVMGVYSPQLVETIAKVLLALGAEQALVVHSNDGMDEISLAVPTKAAEVRDGKVRLFEITPAELGLASYPTEKLRVKSPEESAGIIRAILSGAEKGGPRDIVLANAGAALYVAGMAQSLKDGVALAAAAIDSGKASATLERFAAFTKAS